MIRDSCVGPWLIAGDFNMIYCAADKNNHNLNRAMMGRFRRALNSMELKEIELLGRRFTWSNEKEEPTLVRLDRVFCTSQWEDAFPNHLLQSTTAGVSDHCPLLVTLNNNGFGKRRFHFESFWPKLEGFSEVVAQAWNSAATDAHQCPIDRLATKFIATGRALQSWSQRTVGNVAAQIEQARELQLRLDIAQEARALTGAEAWLRRQLKQHMLAMASLHRTILRARSRIDWLLEGDANTSIFHAHARYRKRKNFISKLHDGDRVATTQEDKEDIVWHYFNNLLGTEAERTVSLNLPSFHPTHDDLHALDEPISEQEAWDVI